MTEVATLAQIEQAARQGLLSESTVANLRIWLTLPHYATYVPLIEQHVAEGLWSQLEAVFWTVLPFGTAGRRGGMYPIGCNAINARTIAEVILAVADYVAELNAAVAVPSSLRAAVAFDIRHQSRAFAWLTCEILTALGWQVYLLEEPRSTPQLATTVRHLGCAAGFMITASHNPPSDNAVKVFWSNGGQLRPPHEERVSERMAMLTDIPRVPFEDGHRSGKIAFCADAMDRVYQSQVLRLRVDSGMEPRRLRILYSPLHGVGMTSVVPVLHADRFHNLVVFSRHAVPDPDFPNVPGHVANPEHPLVFDELIDFARENAIDMVLASDPDADRIGCAVPLAPDSASWMFLNGNQIGVLLANFLLRKRQQHNLQTTQDYLIRTLVTTPMLDAVAKAHATRCYGDVLTGFKWIGSLMDELGPAGFVMGCEEAHGYLVGDHIRDKDAASASMILAEYADEELAKGGTLPQELDRLYLTHGYFAETAFGLQLPGASGLRDMQSLMTRFRQSLMGSSGELAFNGQRVRSAWDYASGEQRDASGTTRKFPLRFPSEMLRFELDMPGFAVAIRPSGTEPKIKFYLFGWSPVASASTLHFTKERVAAELSAIERVIRHFAAQP